MPAGTPAYDNGRLLDEALLLTDWYLPAVLGGSPRPTVRDAYIDAWTRALSGGLRSSRAPSFCATSTSTI